MAHIQKFGGKHAANPEATADPEGSNKGKKHLKIGVAAAVLLICYLAFCVAAKASDTILPRLTTAGVEIGGLTQVEAAQKLEQLSDSSQGKYVVFNLTNGVQTVTMSVPATCIQLDPAGSAAAAYQMGRQDGFLTGGWQYLSSLLGIGNRIDAVYVEGEELDQILQDVGVRFNHSVVQSSYAVEEDLLVLTKGTPGISVERQELIAQITAQIRNGNAASSQDAAPMFTMETITVNPDALDLQAVYDQVHTEAKNAELDSETDEIIDHVVGISFDVDEAQTAFNELGFGDSCQVALELTQPDVTTEQLKASLFRDLLGSATSNIGGTANRLSNVTRAAASCNGVILNPGEEFSYNGTVGSRTTARGYLPAPVYVNGLTTTEVGGGICQVSSTTYLASMRADMEIVERHNHGFAVGYVPDGMDATVYYGSLDFRFKNDKEYPIKIVTSVSGRKLTISIYGTKTDTNTVKIIGKELSRTGYQTIYKEDPSIPAGTQKVEVTPYIGRTVQTYRCIYDENGTLISQTEEAYSVYKSRDQVILIPESTESVDDTTTQTDSPTDTTESTTPDETTPDDTTPDDTTPDDTTPDETTPDETTPDETTPDTGTQEDTSSTGTDSQEPDPADAGESVTNENNEA